MRTIAAFRKTVGFMKSSRRIVYVTGTVHSTFALQAQAGSCNV